VAAKADSSATRVDSLARALVADTTARDTLRIPAIAESLLKQ
jgi:hypothetical protein